MIGSCAHLRTEHARTYLAWLTGAPRLNASDVTEDNGYALLQLPKGYCVLTAEEQGLDVSVYAESMSDVVMLEDMISDCLDAVASDDAHYLWLPLRAANQDTPRGEP